MASLKRYLDLALTNRAISLGVTAGVVVFGVILITIGEILDWGWTRLIGAGLISLGSALFGVIVGWSDPVRPRAAAILRQWGRGVVLLLTAIMVVPVLGGLLLAFGGLIVGGSQAAWHLLLIGILTTILMLGVTAVTVAVALRLALQGVENTSPGASHSSNGRGEP